MSDIILLNFILVYSEIMNKLSFKSEIAYLINWRRGGYFCGLMYESFDYSSNKELRIYSGLQHYPLIRAGRPLRSGLLWCLITLY